MSNPLIYTVYENDIYTNITKIPNTFRYYYNNDYEQTYPEIIENVRNSYNYKIFVKEEIYKTFKSDIIKRLFISENVFIDIVMKEGIYYESLASKYRTILNEHFSSISSNSATIINENIKLVTNFIDDILNSSYDENIENLCVNNRVQCITNIAGAKTNTNGDTNDDVYNLYNELCTNNINLLNKSCEIVSQNTFTPFKYVIKGGTSIIININKINKLINGVSSQTEEGIKCIVPTGDIDITPLIRYNDYESYNYQYKGEAGELNRDVANNLLTLLGSNNYKLVPQNDELYTIEVSLNGNDKRYGIIDIGIPDESDENSIFINTIKLCYTDLFRYMNHVLENNHNKTNSFIQTTGLAFEFVSIYFGIKLYKEYLESKTNLAILLENKRQELRELKLQIYGDQEEDRESRQKSRKRQSNEEIDRLQKFIDQYSKQASDEALQKIRKKIQRYNDKYNNIYDGISLLEIVGYLMKNTAVPSSAMTGGLRIDYYKRYMKYKLKYLQHN